TLLTADGTTTAHSADSAALLAGSYSYQASVATDSNYTGATSTCEPLTVNKAPLGITTDIHNASHVIVTAVPLNSVVHDTATVTGQVDSIALPAITFSLYTSLLFPYTTLFRSTLLTADGTTTAHSADSAALAAGSYSYQASVATDSNYTGATSTCEPL